jgi:hypothetical protein
MPRAKQKITLEMMWNLYQALNRQMQEMQKEFQTRQPGAQYHSAGKRVLREEWPDYWAESEKVAPGAIHAKIYQLQDYIEARSNG